MKRLGVWLAVALALLMLVMILGPAVLMIFQGGHP